MTPENKKLLSKVAGSKGGLASAQALTARQRKARAKKAGKARQAKRRQELEAGGY
jgi:hypothetical protein